MSDQERISLKYQYNINQTSDENKENYQFFTSTSLHSLPQICVMSSVYPNEQGRGSKRWKLKESCKGERLIDT